MYNLFQFLFVNKEKLKGNVLRLVPRSCFFCNGRYFLHWVLRVILIETVSQSVISIFRKSDFAE